jgi:hypothetical protein
MLHNKHACRAIIWLKTCSSYTVVLLESWAIFQGAAADTQVLICHNTQHTVLAHGEVLRRREWLAAAWAAGWR